MSIIDNNSVKLEEWRPGVLTRKLTGSFSGARSLFMMEQTIYPGKGAPSHVHSCEEVLYIKSGTLKVLINNEEFTASANQTVIVPYSLPHSFANSTNGDTVVLVFFPHNDPFRASVTEYL